MIGATVDDREPVGLMFDLVGALAVVALVALPAAWIAVGAAFVLTRASRPIVGWLGTTAAMPLWFDVVDRMPVESPAAYLAMLGLLPGMVRLAMPTCPRTQSRFRPIAPDLSAPAGRPE